MTNASKSQELPWYAIESTTCAKYRAKRAIAKDMFNIVNVYLDAIGEGKSTYVKQLNTESQASYQARLECSFPHSLYKKAVLRAAGALTDDYEIDVSDYKHETVKGWIADMTGNKQSIVAVASMLAQTYWREGPAPWHIEYTKYNTDANNGSYTEDEGQQQKTNMALTRDYNLMRPLLVLDDPSTLLEATESRDPTNKNKPARIRLKLERSTFTDARTGSLLEHETTETYIYIYDTNGVTIMYRTDKDPANEYSTLENTKFSIPGHPWPLAGAVDVKKDDFMVGDPPLLEIAICQWRLMEAVGDNHYIIKVAQIPLLLGVNLDIAKNDRTDFVGVALINGTEGSDLKYVEVSGASIAAGTQKIEDIKSISKTLVGEIFSEESRVEKTATAEVISMSSVSATNSLFLEELAANLTQILEYMAIRHTYAIIPNKKEKLVPPNARVRIKPKRAVVEEQTDDNEKKQDETEGDNTSVNAFIENTEAKLKEGIKK